MAKKLLRRKLPLKHRMLLGMVALVIGLRVLPEVHCRNVKRKQNKSFLC